MTEQEINETIAAHGWHFEGSERRFACRVDHEDYPCAEVREVYAELDRRAAECRGPE